MTEINRFAEEHENAKDALLAKLSEVLESYLDGKYDVDAVISVVQAIVKEKLSADESKVITDLYSFLIRAKNNDKPIPVDLQKKFFQSLGLIPVLGEVVDSGEPIEIPAVNDEGDQSSTDENPARVLGGGGNGEGGGDGGNGGENGEESERERAEVPGFVVKFFQLDAVRGDLWEKDEVDSWKEYDYVQAMMTYVSRDLMAEAGSDYPMIDIWSQALKKKYVLEGEAQKYSLHEDILPAFRSKEIRNEVKWFFNALNSIEKGAVSIEDKRTIGDPDQFFDYLNKETPVPLMWEHFFRSRIQLEGKNEKLTVFDSDLSFGELAQAAVRYLARRVIDPTITNEHNIFAHNAQRAVVTDRMISDFTSFIKRMSPELNSDNGDSPKELAKKEEKAKALAFLVVNYSIKFMATFVPWPISDVNILRYDSLIPTKLFRFGESERKYLTEDGQSGQISVHDKLFIANFGRLLNNGLLAHVLEAKYVSKNEKTGEIEEGTEFVTLLELLMHQSLVVEKDASTTDDNGLDQKQRALLDKFDKVYLSTLPTLIKENIPPTIDSFWKGLTGHANDIWKLIKQDSLPMKSLLREASSRGIFEDFKTKVPAEVLKNNLANIYRKVDYWMGDYVIRDKSGKPHKFPSLEAAKKKDPGNRFMKVRKIEDQKEHYVLMNFRELFILNPDWEADKGKLGQQLEVSKKEVAFMKLDTKRLYSEKGDQYRLLQKLIVEKFVMASIRHYIQEEANKNYLSFDEKKALAELLSSEFAKEITSYNPINAAITGRRPVLFGEAYPEVSSGIWSRDEALQLLSIFPDEPVFYSAKKAVKDKK